VLAAILAFTGACSETYGDDEPRSTTTAATTFPSHARYVAIGGSFAAGSGIPDEATSCRRSDHSYPHLVAAALGVELVDVSCRGATTASVLDTAQDENPPQISAVTPDTALVTITIGGNDLGYSATTVECAHADPRGTTCATGRDPATTEADVAALGRMLSAVIESVRSRAPRAVIVLVSYPRVVPPDGQTCDELSLAPDEAALVRDLGQALEDVTVAVAEQTEVLMVDAYGPSTGHGPCAGPVARWVEGATAESRGLPFHPNANGHRAVADLILDALDDD
jgi:lysophospholipase L1-like esterase